MGSVILESDPGWSLEAPIWFKEGNVFGGLQCFSASFFPLHLIFDIRNKAAGGRVNCESFSLRLSGVARSAERLVGCFSALRATVNGFHLPRFLLDHVIL